MVERDRKGIRVENVDHSDKICYKTLDLHWWRMCVLLVATICFASDDDHEKKSAEQNITLYYGHKITLHIDYLA